MTSTVIDDATSGRKLLIHIAENGHSYEVNCDENTRVEAVQQFMESMAGMPRNDQLLLCADMRLEPHEPLSTYKLPSDQEEVFCFNKARLQANSLPPPPEKVEFHDIAEPPLPSPSCYPHPLDEAIDPALKALPSYERQFRHHYNRGCAIYNRTLANFDTCQKLLTEQKVQERGMEIAGRNLEFFYKILHQNHNEFLKCYSQQQKMHADLLANFDREIEKLRSCKLFPALQTSSRKCLLDLVKEDDLRKVADSCYHSHKQFENKVSQFKHVFGRLKQDVEDLFSSKASLPIKDMEMMIREHKRFINEQKSIMQSLSKDVSTVQKLVDDCVSSQLSTSLRPHDVVSALGPMYEVHEKNHLPKMKTCDCSISDLLDVSCNRKNEMNNFVHSYMQKIAYIQHNIKDVRLQFNAFSEALKRQDSQFEGLRLVRGLGPAYRACLAEIVRRKASMKLYMGMAGQMAEKLAAKRDMELKKREEFLKVQNPYLPRDILASMGLFDTPSQVDVNIVPFDTSLLDIDIADIDRYAPVQLVGFPFKTEREGTPRSSFSRSDNSSKSLEFNLEASASHEILEGSALLEIAGTGKLEVENAKLKAELASAIAVICSLSPELVYESVDDDKRNSLLKTTAEKTAEALQSKDEYIKHLLSELREKQTQSESYENRIKELELKLSDQYINMKGIKSLDNNVDSSSCSIKTDVCKSAISVHEGEQLLSLSGEPMDEASCTTNSLHEKIGLSSARLAISKSHEGLDENMCESSGVANTLLDSSMIDPHHEERIGCRKDANDNIIPCSDSGVGLELSASATAETKGDDALLIEMQCTLEEKTKQLIETESRLKIMMGEVSSMERELETKRKLLDESQLNCAHLENCLHEAREEAQTHLCAADRRASEYSALRASAVKMRSLFERLRSCVNASGGVAGFADSLRSLAQSISNSMNDSEDDGAADVRACIRLLADKVGILSRQRSELLERNTKADAAHKHCMKELEEKKELVKTLYTKLQVEKQANKEKISFCRFEVPEIAAFVLNRAGHYEAISKNISNYFLSSESVALFTDHLPSRPVYIVGQIVHIEKQIVKHPLPTTLGSNPDRADFLDLTTQSDPITTCFAPSSESGSTPFGLPMGAEYFVVTVAMLPDTRIHSDSTSAS